MIGAVLLAAGESTRMGTTKALLPWGERSLLEYGVEELHGAGVDRLVVVLGHQADRLEPLVTRLGAEAVVNPRYRQGRSTSIEAGVRALDGTIEHVLIANVDQPRPREIVARLVAAHRAGGATISRAVHGSRHGHPVILAGRLVPELITLGEATEGLKGLLRNHAEAIQDVPIDDPVVLLNLNDPAAYAEALARFAPPRLS